MVEMPKLQDFALLLDPSDNVATALRDMPAGPYLRDNGEPVHLPEPIPSAFKLAVEPIARGEEICKFGHRIGTATEDIAPGRQVHVHNLASAVGDRAEGEP